MQLLKLDLATTAQVSVEEMARLYERLKPEQKRLAALSHDAHYNHAATCLFAPFDEVMQQEVHALADAKKALGARLVLLIGIGGAHLGALAIHQAVQGLYYNDCSPEIAFYSADTIDTENLRALLAIVEAVLIKGQKIIIVVVSKSGKTLETLVNATLFINLLKRYHPTDYHSFLVFIGDKGSPLYASAYGSLPTIDFLEVPHKVAGRYSVFTPVGLLPLALIGIDIDELCKGARMACSHEECEGQRCLSQTYLDEAALSASVIYYHWQQGIKIHDLFVSAPRLVGLGAWYRQLMGESIGKRVDRAGAVVEVGITPTVSIGTTDLHSVAQLYLAGPRDKSSTFVMIEKEDNALVVNPVQEIPLAPVVEGKSITKLKRALLSGVQHAYEKEKRPFMTLTLKDTSEQAIGAFLYTKMAEMIFLGFLLDVDPFDQPEVESYKREAWRVIEHG